MTRKLAVAILIWKRGEPIDSVLQSELAAQGYDVAKLERRYRA